MTTHRKQRGQQAEQYACDYLVQQGLVLQERNIEVGPQRIELDLIMTSGKTWVFVEVRSRSHTQHGHPLFSITRRKQCQVLRGAEYYLLNKGIYGKVATRFDVVSVVNDNQLEWLVDAFRQ